MFSNDSVYFFSKKRRDETGRKSKLGGENGKNYPSILKSREGLFLSSFFQDDCVRRY